MRQYVAPGDVVVLVWFGQVASGAADEDVEVLGRDCDTTFFRQLRATKTVPGGGWEVESRLPLPQAGTIPVTSGVTFRARWRDELSRTILYRVPFTGLSSKKIAGRRAWEVYANPKPLNLTMTGKHVELQRKTAGRWVRYKRAPLVRKPHLEIGGAYNHEVVFEVPQRGLTLRALLPAKSAAPCYLAKATEPWRS